MAEIKWIKKYEKKVRVIPSPPKPQTNADRIRAMTDEELAVFLSQTEEHLFTGNLWSIKTWNEWLKKEVEE